jgi:hypothetical protein
VSGLCDYYDSRGTSQTGNLCMPCKLQTHSTKQEIYYCSFISRHPFLNFLQTATLGTISQEISHVLVTEHTQNNFSEPWHLNTHEFASQICTLITVNPELNSQTLCMLEMNYKRQACKMKITAFHNVIQCSLVDIHWHFIKTCCPHHKDG